MNHRDWRAAAALLILTALVLPCFQPAVDASPQSWVGNDNAEVGYSCGGCKLDNARVTMSAVLTQNMTYYANDTFISFQYNPDLVATEEYQTRNGGTGDPGWFQPAIYYECDDGGAPCLQFGVNVFDVKTRSILNQSYYPEGGQCAVVSNLLEAGANWTIAEYTNGAGYIVAVYFAVTPPGGSTYLYNMSTGFSHDWYWLTSAQCWCGSNSGYASFSSVEGILFYLSDARIQPIGPPESVSTAEDSNMVYGCMYGTDPISQVFDLYPGCFSTISTELSSDVIEVGSSVTDQATLANVTQDAGGNVTYSYFSGSACTGTPHQVSVEDVTNGTVARSSSEEFATSGNYSWDAYYSGDGNNTVATSACEPLAVEPTQNTLTMEISGGAGTVAPGVGGHSEAFGAEVEITATGTCHAGVVKGSFFSKWEGSGFYGYTGTADPYTVTVDSHVTETAVFSSIGACPLDLQG